ncbi:Nucleotide-binding universal stress protein, UspA family [Desulfurobacterium pacificum]|jgi:nucleotide-binding universal stress UspA family protein|uniref:Nucleotide-binding universal stress protein, UspA family n=1 Tax=Desulfurobacterium pacificum TaxID=240166 RepID=A0ABY1NF90_9BACT|nr:universal stress protein [Desulfurobacterium pacificum]SMP07726.1 Nucleotide-binding universal stress protein, UspA family [Desulfurobacterium pacificum]
MPLFKTVLYSTDFSPLAETALEYVKKLKEAGTKKVVVVHVIESLSIELPEGVDLLDAETLAKVLPRTDQLYITSTIEKLDRIKKNLEFYGFEVEIALRYGNPGDEIVSVAEEKKVSIIVMGAHGKGLLTEILLGSVSVDVMRKAKCPVLIIKRREE